MFLLYFICVKTIVLLVWVLIEYATKDKSIIKVNLLCFLENNRMLKFALVNGLWIGITPKILPKLMMEETLMTCYCCHTILVKLKYTNKGSTIGQHALKEDVVNFAQNLKSVIKLLNTLPLSLKSLSNTIVVHFVVHSHPHIELVKSCKLLYVLKYVITIWFTWFKMNNIGYKNTTMNINVLNILHENDVPRPIMISM